MDYFDILLAKKLSGGGGGEITVEGLSVEENGTYTAPSGKAYSPVVVNLPLGEKAITANGEYLASADDLKGFSKVTVDVAGYKLKSMPAGAISTFNDGTDLPLNQLKFNIVPVQSGSGDPSPSNPRPISGWTGAEVVNSDFEGITSSSSNSLTRQIHVDWKEGNNTYDMPLNVVSLEIVKDAEDNDINVATLESEYVLPFDCVYDDPEAIVALDENQTLVAGDYYFKIVNDSWGNNNGKYVCFTLESDLESPYQIRKKSGAYDAAIEDCTLGIYTSGADRTGTTIAFTVETTQPSSGTSLGQTDGTGYCNHWHCAALGYNRWKYSAIRQFLNSDATAGNWWTQQHKWDVMPDYATTKNGFLYGLSASVKQYLVETKVYTSRNTIFNNGDTPLGGMDETLDKVFLISLEQSYIEPQITGEGEYWEYYKNLLGTNAPVAKSATYPLLIKYDIGAKTTARSRWLRSAVRGSSVYAWHVSSSGYVNPSSVTYGFRCAPCLRIGINERTELSWQTEAGTVYGGYVDWKNRKVVATHANIASYNGESINEPWISSIDKYEEGATPTTGAQVVYPLTTPIEYTLSSVPNIRSILGTNNVWSDTGEITEGEYFASL